MAEWKHKCEFRRLMCAPDQARPDELVTVGLILRDPNSNPPQVEVRIARDFSVVLCHNPDYDVAALQQTLKEMLSVMQNVTDFGNPESFLPDLPVDLALSDDKPVLTNSMKAEAEKLEQQHLVRRRFELKEDRLVRPGAEYGRGFLKRRMQGAFGEQGVLKFLDMDISVERYTFKGNPLTLDFGYVGRLDNKYRMFHATSVVANSDRALLLAFNYPGIRDGILNIRHYESEMISVVEDTRFWQGDTAKVTIDWMQESGIIVRPITDMPSLAAQARRDLLL